MARKDLIHDAVKNALINDGWNVTDEPLFVPLYDKRYFEIDLGAEKVIVASKEKEEIAVEIKSITSGSILNAFHTVLGQYLDYQTALNDAGIERTLYVGVTTEKYEDIKASPFVSRQIESFKINLVIIDEQEEKVVKWIKLKDIKT